MVLLRPASIDVPGAFAAGPTGTLGRGGLRRPYGDQRPEPSGVIGTRLARQPGIDDDPDARNRQAALRDARGQHHPATLARRQHGVLHLGRLAAVQRGGRSTRPGSTARRAATALISPSAGQEHQHIAGVHSESARRTVAATWSSSRGSTSRAAGVDPDGRRRPRRRRWGTARPGAWLDNRYAEAQAPREPFRVDRSRQPRRPALGRVAAWPVVDQGMRARDRCPRAARGTRRASPHRRRAVPERSRCRRRSRTPVVTTSIRGSGGRPGTRRGPRSPPDRRPARRPGRGHPAGRGTGRDAPWLGDDHPPVERVGERERHERRLARARRRDQHSRPATVERRDDIRQHGTDRQVARGDRIGRRHGDGLPVGPILPACRG